MFGIFTHTYKIRETDLLKGYTDFHCHLLPGVDDGVQKMEVTLRLLELMAAQGVKNVWFTPHVMEEMPNTPESLGAVFQTVQENPVRPSLPLELGLAAEHMLDSHFDLTQALRLKLPGNHVLVETSYFSPPVNLKQKLAAIQHAGVFPLLAHPCRYNYMGPKDYDSLHDQGIHFQLNLPAIVGLYGPMPQKKAKDLLQKGYYHFTGTDTHKLSFYQEFLESKLDRKTLEQLTALIEQSQNPNKP